MLNLRWFMLFLLLNIILCSYGMCPAAFALPCDGLLELPLRDDGCQTSCMPDCVPMALER